MKYIAIDIGGTQLRAALYPEEGLEPITLRSIATHQGNEKPEDRLGDLVESIWPHDDSIRCIAAGVAGPVNPRTGIVYHAPNISGWTDFPLGSILSSRFKTETRLGNDANLAGLGEWKHGAGIGHHDLIYLTISTGIGGGIIIDDKMLVGPHGIAAEVGHITVLPGGPLCGCGKRGHLEALSSGTGIANYVKSQISDGRESILTSSVQTISAREVTQAAQQGDELALEAFERAGRFLGQAIADMLLIFEPTIVVLGGGVTKAGDLLMNPLKKALETGVFTPEYLKHLEIAFAKLGDRVGLVGALTLARS
jgi:glucokinase